MRVAAVSVAEAADRRCWLARHQMLACTVWGNVTRQSHLAHFSGIVSEHDGRASDSRRGPDRSAVVMRCRAWHR